MFSKKHLTFQKKHCSVFTETLQCFPQNITTLFLQKLNSSQTD